MIKIRANKTLLKLQLYLEEYNVGSESEAER
jgi:hypothetical protein